MSETSFNDVPMRIDHAAEATRVIAEYFSWEMETSEEDKLRDGLNYCVAHNIVTVDEAEECLYLFKQSQI